MNIITSDISTDTLSVTNRLQEKKEYLLNQENFERLIQVQKSVELATEMRPTFKKLINGLVTDEALERLTNQLIEQMA